MDPALPPDVARKLLHKDLANLVKRVHEGKKLTRAERSMLQNLAGATEPAAGGGPCHARNYVELASILGVTRQAIGQWRRRADAPQAAANGLHEVEAWREFMRRHQLKGSEPPITDEETSLKARKLLAEVEDRELRVAVRKELYVPIDLVKREWTTRVGRAVALLRNKLESELPPILSGLDATGIQDELRKAIDEVLGILHEGDGHG
jgi:transposase-like protein